MAMLDEQLDSYSSFYYGIISYTVLHAAAGKTKDISPLMYILTVVFILKYALI